MTLRMPGVAYVGPPDSNWSNGEIRPPMGMVVHIAEGSFQGTIGWQRNPAADVSSYFVVSQAGEIVQMLDLDLMAWTQAGGNASWVGVENEGFHTGQFTPAQTTANARIFAWLKSVWGNIPYRVSNSPSVSGCGWHGMGGAAWGNHPDCPGPNNVALLPKIVAEAQVINEGGQPAPSTPQRGWHSVLPYVLQDDASIVLAWADARIGKWVYANIVPPSVPDVNVPALVGALIGAGAVGINGGSIRAENGFPGILSLSQAPGAVPPPVVGQVIAKIPDLVISASGTVKEAP